MQLKHATAVRSATVEMTAHMVIELEVIISMTGTMAPAIPNTTVLAPSQGPALLPWVLRVMI